MSSKSKPLAFWLVLSLFAVVIAACGATVATNSGGEEQSVSALDLESSGESTAEQAPESGDSQGDDNSAGDQTREAGVDGDDASEDLDDEEQTSVDKEAENNENNGDESALEDEAFETSDGTETEMDNSATGEGSAADGTNEETAVDAGSSVEAEDGILTDDSRSDRQRLISEEWNTDFSRHTVPYDELLALLPVRDGIPSINNPTFETLEEAAGWLAENEPVIAIEFNGDARAYPLQILTWHEIVNDTVGEIPVVVTFCPLCNSALVFDRRLDGETYDFGTSGWLRHSDLVMYDRTTESLWQQFTGEGIVGEQAGKQLTFLPSSIISFSDFNQAYPEGIVLSRNTGYGRPYGQNPYPGYDRIGQDPFAFIGVPDRRLAAMERVITVSLDDVDLAYPLLELAKTGVISDTQGGQDLVIFLVGGTASALDAPVIFMGDDVGATGVFDPNIGGQKLTFIKDGDFLVDEQTGSTWNIVGQAIEGPLAGEQLTPIVHGDHFWFSWAAFKPDTIIYGS